MVSFVFLAVIILVISSLLSLLSLLSTLSLSSSSSSSAFSLFPSVLSFIASYDKATTEIGDQLVTVDQLPIMNRPLTMTMTTTTILMLLGHTPTQLLI